MRLPGIAMSVCFPYCLISAVSSAEPMGATSRASVQIVASVAPRILISEVSHPALEAGADGLCIQANSPVQSYSVISVDSSGVQRPLAAVSESRLCRPIPGFSAAALQSATNGKSGSAPAMVLVAPE
jgi:hypothetical protein